MSTNKKSKTVKRWLSAINQATKQQQDWETKGHSIVERYRDEDRVVYDSDDLSKRRLNLLWSNIETLKPAVFARLPKPVVRRRYQSQDPLGRAASEVIERALIFTLDNKDTMSVINSVVEDYLLVGRGIARPVYKASYGEEKTVLDELGIPVIDDKGNIETYTEVLSEECCLEYHYWADIRMGPAKQWAEVPWIAWRTWMAKDEFIKRFGKSYSGMSIFLNSTDDDTTELSTQGQAEVWEIWSKSEGKVYWICPAYTAAPLDASDPPVDFKNFFNTPHPLASNTTNGSLIPVPDYCQYQDQAEEIDRITERIDVLTEALKVVGWYAGDDESIPFALNDMEENTLVPVKNWSNWADRGGAQGLIDWYPVATVIEVLRELFQAREVAKQEIYEITGISDLLRGQGDAGETATAQKIKGRFGTLRIGKRQDDIQRYVRDLLQLQAEVICETFSAETLAEMTGLEYSEEEWAQIVELLRNDPLRRYRVDIETDSMLLMDEEADKASRLEFIKVATDLLKEMVPTVDQVPEAGPLMSQMLMFAVRGFRSGRELEDDLEGFIEAMMNRPPSGPTPEEKQAELAAQAEQLALIRQEIEASIRKDLSLATKNEAQAQKTLAEANQVDIENEATEADTILTLAKAEAQEQENHPGLNVIIPLQDDLYNDQ